MKKFCFVIAIFIGILAQGQTYLYTGFASGYWPPEGWTPLPLGPQWSLSQTDHAGGLLPEARFEGFDYTGIARFISPLIDMTGADTAILSFRYFPEVDMTDAPVLGVSTRSGGGTWNNVWETLLINRNEPRQFEVLITGEDIGNPEFQISFFLNGDFNKLQNFYLDDIRLYYPATTDGKLDEILTPSDIDLPAPVVASVINLGNTTITEVGVVWLSNLGIKHDSLFTGLNLGMCETFTFEFNRWWVSDFGKNNLKMWIYSVNGGVDPYHPNDTLIKSINYMIPLPARLPCFEEFTNSNSFDCGLIDNRFVPWCENHPVETVLRYPTNANGYIDPYFTPEIDERRNYYSVEYLPRTFCNGKLATLIDTNEIQIAYDSALKLSSNFDILSTFTLVTDTIQVNTNIFPHESLFGSKVYTVVLEKTTTGNTGQNGITEFHNVVMKIFPDGDGESTDFFGGIPVNQSYWVDLDSTFVEDSTDLMVAVFIQSDSTKEILQSAYGMEDIAYSSENRLSMIYLDGMPLNGFNPDTYVYDVELLSNSVESPVVTGTTMQDSAWMIISQAFELPGSAVIDVYPESLAGLKRYIVNFSLIMNINDPGTPTVMVYPNPVSEKLFISGIENARVKLYSIDGKIILEEERCFENTIDLSGVQMGIYILNLTDKEGNIVMKKIVVM